MVERDPFETQRGVAPALEAELRAVGLEDAEEIGRGGSGVVYRCVQAALDRYVAVKVLIWDLDDDSRARFFREQRAMGRVTGHPNLVGVLHVGTTDSGRVYIVMQYHRQSSLDAQIRRDGPLDIAGVLRHGVRVAGALETAHRLDIIHRNVKPANILLTDYGEPALTDFGIPHIAGEFRTSTGAMAVSPVFAAPEVLDGKPPSPASDIYGLGATLFSALTGYAAFESHSGEQVVTQSLRTTSQLVPNLREQGIPGNVSAAIEWAMSPDQRQRPSTAAALGTELRQLQSDLGLAVDEMALSPDPILPPRYPTQVSSSAPSDWSSSGSSGLGPTLRASAGQLPLELTSFVGRRRELAEVRAMLSSSRLVTLAGVGGVGKTRLALRAAASVRKGFGDGVYLVDLAQLHDEALLVDLVVADLDLRIRSARPLDELIAFLAPRHVLLILDSCEHVIEATAALVNALLHACTDLQILATSREALGIGGEAVLRVPPLAVPESEHPTTMRAMSKYDAVALFTQRATDIPGFEITEASRETVVRICRRLDGLPLPIELAAARLRVMSLEEILARLTDQYALLNAGPRDAPPRQQTLRLSVDWSYELCAVREQRLWARMSVFAGSFELEAAESVCATELTADELLDAVTALIDKSILIRVEAGTTVRFRMLETLRDYGREKLVQAGEALTLFRRYRDWYQAMALEAEAEWISPNQLEWIARVNRELPNLRETMTFALAGDDENNAALQIAAALFPFWLARGLLSEGRRWLERALDRSSSEPTEERIKALCAGSLLAGAQGDLTTAADFTAEGRSMADHMDAEPRARAAVAQADGHLELFRGNLLSACTHFEEAVDLLGTGSDLTRIRIRIPVLLGLGRALSLQGEAARAITCYEQVLEVTEDFGESVFRSYAFSALGVAVWRQGESGRALRLLQLSLRLARLVADPIRAGADLETLAWIACDDHDFNSAAMLMGAAASLRRSAGSPVVMVPALLVHHEECQRRTRNALGDRSFALYQRQGQALSFEEAIAKALGDRPPAESPSGHTGTNLTKREEQVATLVSQGLTSKAIAAKLAISRRTAEGHVDHILTKLGFTSRAQIAAWVVEQASAQVL
ncbi:protein kinase domain-containing protein [Prescottella equi]